jgi:lipoate-protein ligase A
MICRILAHTALDGPAQMALDQAILEWISADPTFAVFRTYEWQPATLSLGYFQKSVDVESDPRWLGVPLVRRPTGGGAIWHHHELTYSLVIPHTHAGASRTTDLYRLVHDAIAVVLRTAGLAAQRRQIAREKILNARPFLCFTDRDPEDIVIRDVKVVGSAQRRLPGAVLQHGSLLLKQSPRTPELLGIGDLGSVESAPRSWSALLQNQILAAMGFFPEVGDLAAKVQDRAQVLEHTAYRDVGWTHRR